MFGVAPVGPNDTARTDHPEASRWRPVMPDKNTQIENLRIQIDNLRSELDRLEDQGNRTERQEQVHNQIKFLQQRHKQLTGDEY
jgi:hypothetical protein